MFCEYQGEESLLKKLEAGILHRIASVQSKNPELISASIYMREDYGLFRSFRRCSNSEALNRGVSEARSDRNNRRRSVDKSGVRKAKLQMRNYYIDVFFC